MNSLIDNSLQCAKDQVQNAALHESLFALVGVWPLFLFITALCVAPLILNRYHRRITTLMSTRASSSEVEDLRVNADFLAIEPESQARVNYSQGSKEMLWTSAIARVKRYDTHILQTVLLHISGLLIATCIANILVISDSYWESLTGFLTLIVLIGMLSTPMLDKIRFNTKIMATLWSVALIVMAISSYVESVYDQESLDGEHIFAIAFLAVLIFSLHAGLSGRQLRNVVPYMAVALSLSSFIVYFIFCLYAFGVCALHANDSDSGTMATFVFSMVAGVFLSARLIRCVARLYEKKKLSDQQIRVGCWLLYTSIFSLMFSQVEDEDSVALRPEAMLVPIVSMLSFWFYFRKSAAVKVDNYAQRLLLLRVFSSDKRGEKWLSGVERYWRHLGPVYMIAGPDIARSSIDPYELYHFLSRNIKALFIRSEQQALTHLNTVDNMPDPDGRYRINEFFCLDDTWELVAKGLIKQSDMVVLDLRDFDLSRIGTAKEIGFIVRFNAFSRSLVLVDNAAAIDNLIDLIRQLTGLQIARGQFVVTEDLSPRQTAMRLLDLREQNLDDLYVLGEPTFSAHLTSEAPQELERVNAQKKAELANKIANAHKIVNAHDKTPYGVNYLVLASGLIGLLFTPLQLLAPLYLLARKVSIRRCASLAAVTVLTAILLAVHIQIIPSSVESGATQTQLAWSGMLFLLTSAIWSVVWYYLSRRANRWVKESQEPLRSALKLRRMNL